MIRLLWIIIAILFGNIFADKYEDLPPSCDNPIYCYGDILHHIQLARIFNDGKTFVDLKMKHSQSQILEHFEDLKQSTGGTPNRDDLVNFVNDNFEKSNELVEWKIPDFKENPTFIQNIENEAIKEFSREIINIWPLLGRKVKQDVFENQERYSLIPVPNGFIVPGGRFQEYYYWDSYWIIDGLLLNEMFDTARGMIENFISVVDRVGFVPNGGRVYYLRRSQPPLLTPMAYLYYESTRDLNWVKHNIAQLDRELTYWEEQSIDVYRNGRVHHLYHYNALSSGPRPESYREDYLTAGFFSDETKQREVYIDLKSGAESGWDFSGRWIFDEEGGNRGNLSHIETRRVAPVDLNAFLCLAFNQISDLYAVLGDVSKSTTWKIKHAKLQNAIAQILWNSKDGIWYDYDIKLDKHRRIFYPTNLTPLWAKCVDAAATPRLGKTVFEYLIRTKALDYAGGIPTSLDDTGEQWDFPNAWAPLQDIVVRGLQNSNYAQAQNQAKILAQRWINANLLGFKNTGELFEKYDVRVPGQFGGGGEYEVQPGFGFTNGVALRFIHDYYSKTRI